MKEVPFARIWALRVISASLISASILTVLKGYLAYIFAILPLVYEISNIPRSLRQMDCKVKFQLDLRVILRRVGNLLLLAFLLLLIFFPVYIQPIMGFVADVNRQHLGEIIRKITKNATTDEEKTKAILDWFDSSAGNMKNIWGKTVLLEIYPLHLYLEEPYLCIRLIGHENPLWVLTSRCGACDEYALLFMEMAAAANLTVRSIHNHGENHNWDEVLINGKWVVVDPSMHLFNVSPSFYDRNRTVNGRVIRLSYAFALYPDGTVEDVTERYTDVSTVTFIAVDEDLNPVPNVSIYVYSNNYMKEWYTGLSCTTNLRGVCSVNIGDGNYTAVARTSELIPLFNKTSFSCGEKENKTLVLILSRDFLNPSIPNPAFLDAVARILWSLTLWCLVTCYVELIRVKCQE